MHTLFHADSKGQWHALVDKQAIVDHGLSIGHEGPRPAFKQSRTCSKRTTFKTATTQRAKTTTHSGFISHKRGGTDFDRLHMRIGQGKSCYQFLGIAPTASDAEIKQKYYKI